ncbi:helix-turn-helix domain-containing protein [Amycolatopsis sp. NPDC001319]|uniref:helix-turn-helix domain-containing protein n=1 Tax=unclassified Amycolatopsis TaxID=2618356 RepID=UPI0036C9E34D
MRLVPGRVRTPEAVLIESWAAVGVRRLGGCPSRGPLAGPDAESTLTLAHWVFSGIGLTVPEVMARLKIGRSTVYDLIRTRQLASITIGRARRIPRPRPRRLHPPPRTGSS